MLHEEFVRSGALLFRWRGLLPWLMVAFLFVVKVHAEMAGARLDVVGNGVWADDGWDLACFAVSLAGLALRVLTVGFVPGRTSGRNTRVQVAESLNRTGAYSLVRHPLYVGNTIVFAGMAATTGDWRVVAVSLLAALLYYERIAFAEEDFLRRRFGSEFEAWARTTPALVPRLRGWRRPELPFSARTVLRREYAGLLTVAAVYCLLEIGGDLLVDGLRDIDVAWVLVTVASVAVVTTLRTLKKHTRFLDVAGRR